MTRELGTCILFGLGRSIRSRSFAGELDGTQIDKPRYFKIFVSHPPKNLKRYMLRTCSRSRSWDAVPGKIKRKSGAYTMYVSILSLILTPQCALQRDLEQVLTTSDFYLHPQNPSMVQKCVYQTQSPWRVRPFRQDWLIFAIDWPTVNSAGHLLLAFERADP